MFRLRHTDMTLQLRRPSALVAAATLLSLTFMAGCSGGDDAMSAGGGDGDMGAPVRADVAAEDGLDGRALNRQIGGEADLERAVISTGRVELTSSDLAALRRDLDALLARYDGFVADEETINDRRGRTEQSRLRVRVPAANFETVMGSFADYATVTSATQEAKDVTTEVIDVQERITSQRASLARLRVLLDQAATVPSLLRVESELTRRQGELESLLARQKYLGDQTSLATIVVVMTLPEAEQVKDDPLEDAGFLTGLRSGWNALVDTALVAATAVGAALPFAAVFTLVGAPLVWWWRHRRQATGRPPQEPTPLPGG